jgi:hypothetical protein
MTMNYKYRSIITQLSLSFPIIIRFYELFFILIAILLIVFLVGIPQLFFATLLQTLSNNDVHRYLKM